ncbi:MAG: M81 family metallopeptidase [Pseudomonadota bacterium]
MRVFVSGLFHEANAFSPIETPLSAFKHAPRPLAGDSRQDGDWIGYGDFLTAVETGGDEAIHGPYAIATPSAPCDRESYQILRREIITDLDAAGSVDAILLFLHGAQTAEGEDDCAGDLVNEIRALVGPECAIGVLLDLHANVSNTLLETATIVAACKEYPHTDFGDVARQLWASLSIQRRSKIFHAWRAVPAFPAATTVSGPMQPFVQKLKHLEKHDGIVSISAIHGFPHADVAHAGAGILVYGSTQRKCDQIADSCAHAFFDACITAAELAPSQSVDDVVELAKTPRSGPLIIAERSDNPGAGGAGDATHLLKAFQASPHNKVAAALLHDPEAVLAAQRAGVGSTIDIEVGGRANELSGAPVKLKALVKAMKSGATQSAFGQSGKISIGDTALLVAGPLNIVVCSKRQQPFSPEVFTDLGLAPETCDVIILKSTNHFYGAFEPFADQIVYCDAKGAASENLSDFPYKNLRRPVFPLDPIDLCRASMTPDHSAVRV